MTIRQEVRYALGVMGMVADVDRSHVRATEEGISRTETGTNTDDHRHGGANDEDGCSRQRYGRPRGPIINLQLNVKLAVPLAEIPYVDYPEIKISQHESSEMPFRYIVDKQGQPIMPKVGLFTLMNELYADLC